MRYVMCVLLVMMVMDFGESVRAEDFQPTLLKLSADQLINYDFEGSKLEIPVTVSGTPCQLIFSVFTKGREWSIDQVNNGYLGWHYVNETDTCIYYSAPYDFDIGQNIVKWDGCDQDGNEIEPIYRYLGLTYYMWAFDNINERQLAIKDIDTWRDFTQNTTILEIDEAGLPRANPIWCTATERWKIGDDPEDNSLKQMTNLVFPDGWMGRFDPYIQRDNIDNVFLHVYNSSEELSSMIKYKYVAGGYAEIIKEWGENAPFATTHIAADWSSAGVSSDGNYLYTTSSNFLHSNEAASTFYIYDMDGMLVDGIDLSPWWSSEEDYMAGGQMNGGPNYMYERNGLIFFHSHGSCLTQMVNPLKYKKANDIIDFIVWSNGNGDYVNDIHYEETADKPWVCNDYGAGHHRNHSADENLFSMYATEFDRGPSFSLIAPDGTGIGYFTLREYFLGCENGFQIVDSETPFDGIFTGTLVSWKVHIDPVPHMEGAYFIGHDSIKGVIGRTWDCWDSEGWVKLVTPDGGETMTAGETFKIHWEYETGCNMPRYVIPKFSIDNGITWTEIENYIETTESYVEWQIPNVQSEDVLVRLASIWDGSAVDESKTVNRIIKAGVHVEKKIPSQFSLLPNHPNPFNPVTTIPFTLANESEITLTVYNIAGEKTATLANGSFPAGSHNIDWNASEYASGVYFYRLTAGKFVETRKMTLVK